MKIKFICLLIVVTISGCAYQSVGKNERPEGVALSKTAQGKYASASHWQLLANNEAKLIRSRLDRALYIEKPSASSIFFDTYHNLLTSSLVQNNSIVLKDKLPSAITVTYDVNVVTHEYGKKESELTTPHSKLIYYITTDAAEIIKAPFYAIKDQMLKNLSTITEVVITTQAHQNSLILFSNSNVYFIEPNNDMNYIGIPPSTSNTNTNTPVLLQVVGD